jgi:hypothetical protein
LSIVQSRNRLGVDNVEMQMGDQLDIIDK